MCRGTVGDDRERENRKGKGREVLDEKGGKAGMPYKSESLESLFTLLIADMDEEMEKGDGAE